MKVIVVQDYLWLFCWHSLLLLHRQAHSQRQMQGGNILFYFNDSDPFACYCVNADGLVNIVFAGNMADKFMLHC